MTQTSRMRDVLASSPRPLRDLFTVPLAPIPSGWWLRVQVIAWALIAAQPIFYVLWKEYLPQPKDYLALRVLIVVMALPMVVPWISRRLSRAYLEVHWLALCFLALPVCFLLLYRLNGYSQVWMGLCVWMIFVMHYVTDWRLSGLCLAAAVPAVALAELVSGAAPSPTHGSMSLGGTAGFEVGPPPGEHVAILLFSWVTALLIAVSATNLRLERARTALATIGILAHELRTPIASAGVLTGAMADDIPAETRQRIVERLYAVLGTMNKMIDFQLANARAMDIPPQREAVDVARITSEAVLSFPLANPKEREAVRLEVEGERLHAIGHDLVVHQIVVNLVSNALRAVMMTGRELEPGDVVVRVYRRTLEHVAVSVVDRGVGLTPRDFKAIFEPFQTGSQTPSHGLGLTFCRNAAHALGGDIWCESEGPGHGATFHVVFRATQREPHVVE